MTFCIIGNGPQSLAKKTGCLSICQFKIDCQERPRTIANGVISTPSAICSTCTISRASQNVTYVTGKEDCCRVCSHIAVLLAVSRRGKFTTFHHCSNKQVSNEWQYSTVQYSAEQCSAEQYSTVRLTLAVGLITTPRSICQTRSI